MWTTHFAESAVQQHQRNGSAHGLLRVLCHECRRSKRRCATVREMKEGRSVRWWGPISSHRKLLRSKSVVVSVTWACLRARHELRESTRWKSLLTAGPTHAGDIERRGGNFSTQLLGLIRTDRLKRKRTESKPLSNGHPPQTGWCGRLRTAVRGHARSAGWVERARGRIRLPPPNSNRRIGPDRVRSSTTFGLQAWLNLFRRNVVGADFGRGHS